MGSGFEALCCVVLGTCENTRICPRPQRPRKPFVVRRPPQPKDIRDHGTVTKSLGHYSRMIGLGALVQALVGLRFGSEVNRKDAAADGAGIHRVWVVRINRQRLNIQRGDAGVYR